MYRRGCVNLHKGHRMTFETLGLSDPILRAVRASGYTTPTPIQEKAIPAILDGVDVMAAAQTGTGKTAGFILPLLHKLSQKSPVKRNHTRALVLTPTRELAAQVQESVLTYGKYLQLRSAVVFGGINIRPQITRLHRGVDVLVATPGRLLDLYQQNAIRFDELEILVLDEADRMLDMGFIHDIKKIMSLLPRKRQNLMFSATFSKEIRLLARKITNDPIEIDVAPRNSTLDSISQKVHPVDKARKPELLSHLIRRENWHQVLVFSRTRHGSDKLVKQLSRDAINAVAIHGNKSQPQRTRALDSFRNNRIQVLVATDIASRGLDIDQLPHVVNFDLPHVPEDYIHRIGRTGRAGATGQAISLVSSDELKQLNDIERLIQRTIEREEIEDFQPGHFLSGGNSVNPDGDWKRPYKTGRKNNQRGKSGKQNGTKSKKTGSRHRRSGSGAVPII